MARKIRGEAGSVGLPMSEKKIKSLVRKAVEGSNSMRTGLLMCFLSPEKKKVNRTAANISQATLLAENHIRLGYVPI